MGLLRAYAISLNSIDILERSDSGAGINVGILDTALAPPEGEQQRFEVAEKRDYTELSCRDPTNHGTCVFGALSPFARAATFSFYRLFGEEEREVYSTDFLEPIADAGRDSVDLLNISAGFPHDDARGSFRVRKAIRTEANRGTTVVAAAGNVNKDPSEQVNCPALYDEAIAVGGFVPECTVDIITDDPDRALWIRTVERRDLPDYQGPICSQMDCSDEHKCDENRHEHWWRWNVRRKNDKPDVLAPVHYMTKDERGPYLIRGTSFSAPIVTGQLAALLATVDGSPTSEALSTVVRRSTVEIDDGTDGKFNADRAKRLLQRTVGAG